MSRRTTNARVRRVALSFGALLATLAVVPAASPTWSGSSPVAWAETQTISDGATVQAPDRVRQGEKIRITGRGWTTSNGRASVIAIKLDDGDVTQTTPVTNPATGDAVTDLSVVAAVRAKAKGNFSVAVPVPDSWVAGSRHSIRLLTGKLLNDDSTRSVALTFDIVAGPRGSRPRASSTASEAVAADSPREASASPTAEAGTAPAKELPRPLASLTAGAAENSASPVLSPSAPPSASKTPETSAAVSTPGASTSDAPGAGGASGQRRTLVQQDFPADAPDRRAAEGESAGPTACVSEEPVVTLTSPKIVRGVPVVDLGGSLILTGAGFCGSAGGARIAVQIDDGLVARRDSSVNPDRSVWQIIDAGADGAFATTIHVPDGSQTDPRFEDGAHRLRLVTGSLRARDPSRSVRTIEFVVATGNNAGVLPEPTSVPQAVDPVIALVGPKAGAVTAARAGSTVRVVVPDLEPGDWVYPYVFGDGSSTPKETGDWMQLDADRAVVLDADDVIDGAASGLRLSLQARDGTLVGWATVFPATAQPVTSKSADTISDDGVTAEPQPTPTRSPRPLVVGGSLVLMLIGIVSLVHARYRRRRMLRDLNGD